MSDQIICNPEGLKSISEALVEGAGIYRQKKDNFDRESLLDCGFLLEGIVSNYNTILDSFQSYLSIIADVIEKTAGNVKDTGIEFERTESRIMSSLGKTGDMISSVGD